jgi:hypothetical protein
MQSSLSRRYLINISQIGVSAQAVYWNYENSRPSSFLGHVEGFVCAEEAGSTIFLTSSEAFVALIVLCIVGQVDPNYYRSSENVSSSELFKSRIVCAEE